MKQATRALFAPYCGLPQHFGERPCTSTAIPSSWRRPLGAGESARVETRARCLCWLEDLDPLRDSRVALGKGGLAVTPEIAASYTPAHEPLTVQRFRARPENRAAESGAAMGAWRRSASGDSTLEGGHVVEPSESRRSRSLEVRSLALSISLSVDEETTCKELALAIEAQLGAGLNMSPKLLPTPSPPAACPSSLGPCRLRRRSATVDRRRSGAGLGKFGPKSRGTLQQISFESLSFLLGSPASSMPGRLVKVEVPVLAGSTGQSVSWQHA